MTDMQDRIKELAIEAGAKPFSGYLNNKPDMEFLGRFAQAIARECVEICMARSLRPMPTNDGWSENEWDLIQGACELDAVEIEHRFGLATPTGDDIKQD